MAWYRFRSIAGHRGRVQFLWDEEYFGEHLPGDGPFKLGLNVNSIVLPFIIKMLTSGIPWWSSVRTAHFYCQGPRLSPWWRNQDPTSGAARPGLGGGNTGSLSSMQVITEKSGITVGA